MKSFYFGFALTSAIAIASPSVHAQSEILFPSPPAFVDAAIDHKKEMNDYFERFGVFERLRFDLREAVKERATGLYSEVCKGSGSSGGIPLRDLLQSPKFDKRIDDVVSGTNAMDSALGIAKMRAGPDFSGGNFARTKSDLDVIPSNSVSKQMFYKWIGLEHPQGGFVLRGYTSQFDVLARRLLGDSCAP